MRSDYDAAIVGSGPNGLAGYVHTENQIARLFHVSGIPQCALHPSTLPFPQRQTTEARRSDWVTAIMRLVDNWTTHHSDTRLLAQGTNMGKRRRAGFETGLV
jgi:hypothetical protein